MQKVYEKLAENGKKVMKPQMAGFVIGIMIRIMVSCIRSCKEFIVNERFLDWSHSFFIARKQNGARSVHESGQVEMESAGLWRKFDGLWKENFEFVKRNGSNKDFMKNLNNFIKHFRRNLEQGIPGKMNSGVRNDNGFRMELKECSMRNNGQFSEKILGFLRF